VAEIRLAFPEAGIRLIKSSGGIFEVTADGLHIFSKKALGRHAAPGEVVQLLRQKTG
jgi:predicted Rdx family selenoprotein